MALSDNDKVQLSQQIVKLIELSNGLINWNDIGAKATEMSMRKLSEQLHNSLSHLNLEQLRFVQQLAQERLFPSQSASTTEGAKVISMHEYKARKGSKRK